MRLGSVIVIYRLGNVFFDPQTGDILICDNDNVVIDGSDVAIGGTPDFMATGDRAGRENTEHRNRSLSACGLALLPFAHCSPALRRKVLSIHSLDLPARTKLCGTEPVFILILKIVLTKQFPGMKIP